MRCYFVHFLVDFLLSCHNFFYQSFTIHTSSTAHYSIPLHKHYIILSCLLRRQRVYYIFVIRWSFGNFLFVLFLFVSHAMFVLARECDKPKNISKNKFRIFCRCSNASHVTSWQFGEIDCAISILDKKKMNARNLFWQQQQRKKNTKKKITEKVGK